MAKVGDREYKTVFEDYPYQKLFDSLGNGIVELETNSFEVGQIYIFIRHGTYSAENLEDLEIVEKILPMQLKQMFGEGNLERDMSRRDWRPMFQIDGKRFIPLDIDDSFIMSCYGEDERLNHRFKYSDIKTILSFFNILDRQGIWGSTKQSDNQGLIIKQFGNGSYNSTQGKSFGGEGDWAYVFKIPLNPLTRAFMNWTKNPFV
jgi:hypothetical protein